MSCLTAFRLDKGLERQIEAALEKEMEVSGEVNRSAMLRKALRIGLAQLHNATAPGVLHLGARGEDK